MQNLEQIRAASVLGVKNSGNAGDFAGQDGGASIAKKLPVLIINHGLLQTLAFANEKKGGYVNLLNHLAKHLTNLGIVDQAETVTALIKVLSEGDSLRLRQATAESLAWFNYARRFI